MSDALKLKPQIEIKLVIQKGPHAGQRFSFSKKEISIGRSPENDIVLLNDPLISRQHAKVVVVGSDVEIFNLSPKNSILVQGETVQKWKLVNSATFMVGDTEFQIQFDLGQSVVPMKPAANLHVVKPVVPAQAPKAVQKSLNQQTNAMVANSTSQQALQVQQKQMQTHKPQPRNQQLPNMQFQPPPSSAAAATNSSINGKIRFYVVLGIVALAAYFYLSSSGNKSKVDEKRTILKYSDEVAIKLNSKLEIENQKKFERLYEQRNSPTALRAQENFLKGMRDFQLGNYTRAQEFFQVVLNLQPSHELAKRHLYLSKVRFDEVLKAKLMLGESYYQKHNFRMCQSLYEQVKNMLDGKSSDQNFQIATAMAEKCKLSAEGVR